LGGDVVAQRIPLLELLEPEEWEIIWNAATELQRALNIIAARYGKQICLHSLPTKWGRTSGALCVVDPKKLGS
jgi:hypothetical protein